VLRFALSRRWVPWHLFCGVLVAFMIVAGTWQWEVAFSGVGVGGETGFNARNLVYALQWWVFAAFGVWFWFRFLRDQRDAELAELSEAVASAPEQVHDLSHPTEVKQSLDQPAMISLDEAASARRARAVESLAGGSVTPESEADTTNESKSEGSRQ
jgi:hypothetical protein